MAAEVRAVIDIGTNSVKLLVGEINGGEVRPLLEGSHQTRLGQGFYENHLLQSEAIRITAEAVAEFAEQARGRQARSIKVFATSAARDARNKEELLNAVERAAALPVIIISGEQEADLAYRGVTTDPSMADRPLIVMDVGGGSTEFIVGSGRKRLFAESFPLGSVRLLEQNMIEDPPSAGDLAGFEAEVRNILQREVRPKIVSEIKRLGAAPQFVGTGGTSTILARIKLKLDSFDRDQIEGAVLTAEEVDREKLRLWSLPLAERKKIMGLPANRADVILPGVIIFNEVMKCFKLDTLRVSTRGIRFAALIEL